MAIPVQARDEAALQASIDAALASRPDGEGDVWLFVYGVLAADPPFGYQDCTRATLPGFRRAFCLHDPFNRGTPHAPGLVLGLEPGNGCDGLAYRIAEKDLREGLSAVWRQEMRFPCYEPIWREAALSSGNHMVLVFDTNRNGPFYRPAADEAQAADIIVARAGPAGTNQSYLDETIRAFRRAGVVDPYLDSIEARTNAVGQKTRAANL